MGHIISSFIVLVMVTLFIVKENSKIGIKIGLLLK